MENQEIPDDLGGTYPLSQNPSPEQSNPSSVQSPSEASVGPTDEQVAQDNAQYSTPSQQVATALEGAAQGVAGPLATGAERMLGIPAADIAGRAAANPVTHGVSEAAGFTAGMFTGYSEAGLLAKAGEAAAHAAELGKYGSMVLKGAVEGGLLQTGEEGNKLILGQEDPEAPVASALSNIGYAGLLGGGLSAGIGVASGAVSKGLKGISESKAGAGLSQLMQDFTSKWKFISENPDLTESVTKELKDFHASTSEAANDVYGANGLKSKAVAELTKDVTPELLAKHVASVEDLVAKAPKGIRSDDLFQDAVSEWRSKVTPSVDPVTMQATWTPPASEVFEATNSLKRQLGEWAKFDKQSVPLSEMPFRKGAMSVGANLKNSLEDTSVWGPAGELQSGINKAFSDFKPANDDFNSRFGAKIGGEAVVDPGKVATYVKQLGNPLADIKQTMLQNYVDAAEKYRGQIGDLYGRLGVESPLVQTPLSAAKGTYAATTPGGDMADFINKLKVSTLPTAGTLGHAGLGAAVGGVPGAVAGYIASPLAGMLESAVGRKLKNTAVPWVLSAMRSNNPAALASALEQHSNVQAGAATMKSGLDHLFNTGEKSAIREITAKHSDKEHIRKFIEGGGTQKQLQNQSQSMQNSPTPTPSQSFAEGGTVEAQPMPSAVPASHHVSTTDKFSGAFPAQGMLMSAAKDRVYNYLNSIRPQNNAMKAPYDSAPDQTMQKRNYERALDIAAAPMSIMNGMKRGALPPSDLNHFRTMWPEIHNQLSKQMTERITNAQLKKEPRPPYATRLGIASFLGSPVDSTMSAQGIQLAQNTMMPQQPPQGAKAPTKAKKSTAPLSKAPNQYQTPMQAGEARARGDKK